MKRYIDETRERTVPSPPDAGARGWSDVAIFIIIAFGLGWLICLPLWIGDSRSAATFYLGLPPNAVFMFAPAVATFIVLFFVRRPRSILRSTGLWPLRPFGRFAGYCLVASILPLFLGLVATLFAAGLGVIELDLEDFSMLRLTLSAVVPGLDAEGTGFPAGAFLRGLLLLIATSFMPLLLPSFGEEWGWRGYLLPRLLPLGIWPALLLTGLIWGLWHAPLLLAGVDGFGDLILPLLFMVNTMLMGVIFGWLRLASGSVWPAVVIHAANNSMNALGFLVLADASSEPAPTIYAAGLGGIVGCAALGAFVIFLSVTRRISSLDIEQTKYSALTRQT